MPEKREFHTHLIEFAKRGAFDDIYTPYPIALDFAQFFSEIYYWSTGKELSVVWECAGTEESTIVKAFESVGINCIATDIKTGTDFLTCEIPHDVQAVVTNPPYSLKDEFIARAVYHAIPFAFLVPITTLGGITRGKLFKQLGSNISLRIYSKRIDFTGKRRNWFNVMWLYWIKDIPSRLDFVMEGYEK